ncbi:amidase [Benzoatithermus flavus]|uniref:Amidase n=1 Tax=Benzoatithermus flavus TaxID=3108223 RepID=A0ABU8XP35_9PROT
MTAREILDLGVAELAMRIARGEIGSREATEAVLEALDGPGRALGVVARLEPERALARAEAADAARARGEALGPLHGVPLAHKDMFYRAGELAECGAALMRGHRPAVTATVLARLDAAGAIDVGRLNMVEFALGITGHNSHTGHPQNPWDRTRITGGSTSGGAAAVAARLVPATLGSDTGGSIRVPSACCGLVGIKPTYGRVSRFGCMPLSFSLDHIGPLARSAEDLALLLQAIAGHDPNDPTTSARPVPDYRAGLGEAVRGLRLAVAAEGVETEIDPEVVAVQEEALRVMADLGLSARPQTVASFKSLNALRRVIMLAECAAYHREWIATARDRYNLETANRMEPGFAFSAVDYLRAVSARATLLERFCKETFAAADLLVLPTSPVATPRIADTATGGDARFMAVANRMGALVGPFNYLGLPALNLPIGFDANGMPIGLQLVAPPFAEGLLLRMAHAFEAATGVARKRPPFTGIG